ncbi:MAG: phospholipid/cholesterol/gamma-HCH transport system substrate-binding protein, partial [Pseudonocardiales bacterium]|nr:phospholipid/cholesterol/gamma-HCH transport system substrate-binding protein [Pseudonocardiales bacterium]
MSAPDGDKAQSAAPSTGPKREVDPRITRGGLKPSTKFKLILFVVITLLGVSFVAAKYVGLAKYVTGDDSCTVTADFPDSGGIFTNAEVSYRGVTVGQVGTLHLIKGGTRVDLKLDNCSDPDIPKSSIATVADRSVVGEQYVDISPPPGTKGDGAPFLQSGDGVGSITTNRIPTATQTLLIDLDRLFRSVPLDALRTTIDELGQSVAGRGDDLGRLLDATDAFIGAASRSDNVNATIQLIDQSTSVLQTQLDQREPLQIWTHNLNLLSQQLRTSDPDFRHLLNTGPGDIATVTDFVKNNQTDLGVTLANLATVGDLLVRHLDGIEQIFELYPLIAANGPTTLHDRVGWLGFVLQAIPDPQDCGDPDHGGQGYGGTVRRPPANVDPMAPNVGAHCTAPNTGPHATSVRGSAHVPGGDPISVSGGGYVYP